MSQEDQPKLLAKIRALSKRIVAGQQEADEKPSNYHDALALQLDRTKRKALQAQLDPIRLVAEGVSCRDCWHFRELPAGEPTCLSTRRPTSIARLDYDKCGPLAARFYPVAAHA
jgi:hypothetical protein